MDCFDILLLAVGGVYLSYELWGLFLMDPIALMACELEHTCNKDTPNTPKEDSK